MRKLLFVMSIVFFLFFLASIVFCTPCRNEFIPDAELPDELKWENRK